MSKKPAKPAAKVEELKLPPTALEAGGYEVLRVVIVDGNLHVSLRRAFDEPQVWGILLADVARHIGRIYGLEAGMRENEVVEKVWATFEAEMEGPTDLGDTRALS